MRLGMHGAQYRIWQTAGTQIWVEMIILWFVLPPISRLLNIMDQCFFLTFYKALSNILH